MAKQKRMSQIDRAIAEARHELKYGSPAFVRSRLERLNLGRYYTQVAKLLKL